MKVLGITAEYDPFHNGHRYHLETAKNTVSPDATVCVMSGDITQRGEFAVLDKWKRAKIAADQGVDMVLELPFLYAVSPASCFAQGAVDILIQAGATHIAFGCEAEEPEKLRQLARLQISEAEHIEELTRIEMKSGLSHVKARHNATRRIIGEELTGLSLAPNNILALEYMKRMMFWQERGIRIEAVPIQRKGSGYKEAPDGQAPAGDTQKERFAGGSAIRVMLEAGWDVSDLIPYDIADYSPDHRSTDDGFEAGGWIDLKAAGEEMLKQLRGIVLRTDAEELSRIRFVGEGIENKLIREIAEADSYKDLLKRMTSRRYTTSTIRRMLICIALGINKDTAEANASSYGRILALADPGRRLISAEPGLPFIANINKRETLTEAAERSLEMDVRAADLFNLLTGQDAYALSDHRQRPYIRQGGSR